MALARSPGGYGEPLVADLVCRTSKGSRRGRPHQVTITADWSFESPHDLAAERVAAAFGGFTSCIGTADRAVPALREVVHLLARDCAPPVTAVAGRGWMLTAPVEGCVCQLRFFKGAVEAARHARDLRHVARRYAADVRDLEVLVTAATRANNGFAAPPAATRAAARLIREDGGAAVLWSVGVHPVRVPELAALVPGCDEPLPTSFFLGAATRDLDTPWLARILAHRPDPDVASWLAWSDEAVAPTTGDDCGQWLALGVPLRDVEELLAARTRPEAARELASLTGLSDRAAAIYLANWGQAGCRPTATHVLLLERLGVSRTYRPAVTAVNLLEVSASELPDAPSRTELAVMLAIAGTRTGVLDLLVRGARTPHDAFAAL